MAIELITRQVGTQWVVTSPEVPELYVVGRDEAEALSHVDSALAMLARMKGRLAAKKDIQERVGKHEAA
jgi:hypothetical protein